MPTQENMALLRKRALPLFSSWVSETERFLPGLNKEKLQIVRKFILSFVVLFYFQVGWLRAAETSLPENYKFAEMFFQENDFYRAATEFQRVYFSLEPGMERDLGILRAAESLYFGRQGNLCLNTLNELADSQNFGQRIVLLKIFCRAETNLMLAAAEASQWPEPFASHQSTIWRTMHSGEFKGDQTLLLQRYDYPLPEGLSYPLVNPEFGRVLYSTAQERKSPALAAFLSTLFPGTGQWYYGSFGDGLTSFSAIAFLGAIGVLAAQNNETTLAVLSFTGSGIFYAAGIYGAWRGAERFNERAKDELRRQAAQLTLRYEAYRFN